MGHGSEVDEIVSGSGMMGEGETDEIWVRVGVGAGFRGCETDEQWESAALDLGLERGEGWW